MNIRYYASQLAALDSPTRMALESCAVAKNEKWIDVAADCLRAKEAGGPAAAESGSLNASNVPAKSRGLGDTIARAAKTIRMHKVAAKFTRITGIPCGCEERQAWLNAAVPYEKDKKACGGS